MDYQTKLFRDENRPEIRFEVMPSYRDEFPIGWIPRRQTEKSAGYDLRAFIPLFIWPETPEQERREVVIKPGESCIFSTGLTVKLPDFLFLDIRPRSGLAFEFDITLSNSPATIDADFYGKQILIKLRNEGKEPFTVKHGDRIAQGVIQQYMITSDDEPVKRERTGGLGSTGTN